MRKEKFFRILILSMGLTLTQGQIFAQDILDVPPFDAQNNPALVSTILGDTTAAGERANLNRIYRLERNGIYVMESTIVANYSMRLIAADGAGRPPMIVRGKTQAGANVIPLFRLIGDGTSHSFRDIIFQGVDLDRAYDLEWFQGLVFQADDMSVSFSGCVFNGFTGGATAFAGSKNISIYFRDSIWRNGVARNHPFIGQQTTLPALPVDTLVVTNCTYFNNNSFWLFQENNTTDYVVIEHNTIFTSAIDDFRMRWLLKANVRSNLFYGVMAYGDTPLSRASSWYETDGSSASYISLEEVPSNLLADAGLTEADRIVNVTNNAYFWPQAIQDYWAAFDSVDAPLWINERTQNLFDDDANWPGFTAENNVEADPNFTDTAMDQTVSEEVALWCTENRNTSTIGWGTASGPRNYDALTGSSDILTDIQWPLPESMAYSNATLLTAGHDGLPVGNLNWDPAKRAQYVEPDDIFPTSVKSATNGQTPEEFTLAQNYPNPFNPSTFIKFNVNKASTVTLSIHNVVGQKVATLVNRKLSAGSYEFKWNGRDAAGKSVAGGLYFYRLQADKQTLTKKMLYLK